MDKIGTGLRHDNLILVSIQRRADASLRLCAMIVQKTIAHTTSFPKRSSLLLMSRVASIFMRDHCQLVHLAQSRHVDDVHDKDSLAIVLFALGKDLPSTIANSCCVSFLHCSCFVLVFIATSFFFILFLLFLIILSFAFCFFSLGIFFIVT
jgi:hypothetical protein